MARQTSNTKNRDDDARGTPPGQGTVIPAHGGRIGNPAFEPTEHQRQQVRNYAKLFPLHGEHLIARLIGVSRDTLRKYFSDEIELGRAEMIASIGAQMIQRAMDENATGPDGKPVAKGNMDAMKFVLARLGGWTTKVEFTPGTAPGGGFSKPDLTLFTDEQLADYGRLSAAYEGLDPDEVVGPGEE